MRICWVNASVGSAGDMLLAALIDAGADQRAVMSAWAGIDVGGYAATWERVDRQGVGALWTNIVIDNAEHGDHEHPHDGGHDHGHSHRHAHRPAADVIALIDNSDLNQRIRTNAIAVYQRLAEVEARVHGMHPDDVELHEVGALDSILDIVGVCAALDDLNIERLVYSPVAVGHGTIHAAHGHLANPAPAVVHLLADANAPTVGIDTTMELTTPTAAALSTVLGQAGPLPAIDIEAAGFGAGTADPIGRANVVSILIGSATSADGPTDSTGSDEAHIVETNVDDVTGEVVAHTIQRLLESGAADAWATPIIMKKGRPAYTVAAMCNDTLLERVRRVLLTETGSLGARAYRVRRWPTERTEITVAIGEHQIAVKLADHRIKVEFDDARAAALALDRPVREILDEARRLASDTATG